MTDRTRHPFRFGALAMTPTPTRGAWTDEARRIEAAGYATLQVSDHVVRTPLAPLVALAAAAQVTTTIGLGTLVLDNDFREPAMLVKEAATLDALSDGRFELGLGAGWLDEDYLLSGITQERPGVRIAKLRETVAILRAAFGSNGAPVTVTGEHYDVRDLPTVPAPVRPGGPRLLLGGGGPKVLRLAASEADIVGVNLMNTEGHTGPGAAASAYADAIDAKIAVVDEAAAAAGRDPERHVMCYWAEVTEDPEEALRRKVAALPIPVTVEEIARSPHCLVGPLGALRERVAELRERWGFSYFSVYAADAGSVAALVEATAGT